MADKTKRTNWKQLHKKLMQEFGALNRKHITQDQYIAELEKQTKAQAKSLLELIKDNADKTETTTKLIDENQIMYQRKEGAEYALKQANRKCNNALGKVIELHKVIKTIIQSIQE